MPTPATPPHAPPAAPRPAPAQRPSTGHARMLGALLVRRLPGFHAPATLPEQQPNGLFLLWLAYMGLLTFGAWLLWQAGVWHRLLEVDPTRLTLAIVLVFVGSSLWCGQRAWVLGQQHQQIQGPNTSHPTASNTVLGWAAEYHGTHQPADQTAVDPIDHIDPSVRLQVLGERAHGPHEMAWWLNGIQLKLGLLGKVIGFSMLALQLGQTDSFDPSQSAQLLRNLTGGLGVALLTTVTGLCGNILLGLQLMRLDRYADALVADIVTARHTSPGAKD